MVSQANSRHFCCRGPGYLYLTLLERQFRGRILVFLSNSVCSTETLSDSSNNHYYLSHLQDLLDILGYLPEMESLGVAWRLFKYVNKVFVSSGWTEGQCRKEGGKPSLPSLQQMEER